MIREYARHNVSCEQSVPRLRNSIWSLMTTQTSLSLEQIHALLARRQYAVREISDSMLSIQEVESGISLRAVLEGEILFLSLVCMVVPESAMAAPVMRKMLDGNSGISTSYFQLYDAANGQIAI